MPVGLVTVCTVLLPLGSPVFLLRVEKLSRVIGGHELIKLEMIVRILQPEEDLGWGGSRLWTQHLYARRLSATQSIFNEAGACQPRIDPHNGFAKARKDSLQ